MKTERYDFVVFVLSHGRANNVATVKSLKRHGYSGKVVIVCDDEDDSLEEYQKNFEHVEVFNKAEIAKTFDEGDNFKERKTIVYARNACFEIAKRLGYLYFIQLDDDYNNFDYRVYSEEKRKPSKIKNLDSVFNSLLEFYVKSPFATISMAQGGDFIGGKDNVMAKKPTIYRKCMNSFICCTERPFNFIGRINEDVNTYVKMGGIGLLMGTVPMVSLTQKTTQKNSGGMTETYLSSGTYVKSFYTVMYAPSCTTIKPMGDKHYRLHHAIKWESAVPKILPESLKK